MIWPFRRVTARRFKRPVRRGGHEAVIAIGLFFASIFDPKTKILTEMIDKQDSRRRTDPGKENA